MPEIILLSFPSLGTTLLSSREMSLQTPQDWDRSHLCFPCLQGQVRGDKGRRMTLDLERLPAFLPFASVL